MKTFLLRHSWIFLLLLCLGLRAQAQNPGGIVVVEQRTKTIVYDIRVVGLRSTSQAEDLDRHFRTKEGIFNVQTDFVQRVCRVEASAELPSRLLEHIVNGAGFQVAKSFEE